MSVTIMYGGRPVSVASTTARETTCGSPSMICALQMAIDKMRKGILLKQNGYIQRTGVSNDRAGN